MYKVFFINGKAVTKTELLNDAEKKTRQTKSKNKRRLREGLTFRLAKDYSNWATFVGGYQPICIKSVPHINLESVILSELKKDGITEPCIAVFRLGNNNFVYSYGNKPVILNGRVIVDRGGSWKWYVDKDGNMIWYVAGADSDRVIEGAHLLVNPIPFPRGMSKESHKIAMKEYGQLFDRYHIIPDYPGDSADRVGEMR